MENEAVKGIARMEAEGKLGPSGPRTDGGEGQVYKERVCFNPHPKTLTMAGDYEYFAAQGHHPLAFALAELVDNALRATKGNTSKPRSIVVSLVLDDAASRGLVAVRDNGVGMTPQELNNWAVMNLSMEDRGLLDPAAQQAQPAGGRYLSGDISYFGVGSKNAAFFLGRTVKVVTRPQDGRHVHELCISGAELERRFKAGEVVYEEDMLHRPPGVAAGAAAPGTAANVDQGFQPAGAWLAEEAAAPEGGGAPAGGSFTRVVIGDLKPEVLSAISEDGGLSVLRDLAHLYHYYIHGPKGNAFVTPAAREQERQRHVLPGGEALPDIIVELLTEDCALPCACGAAGDVTVAAASGDSGHGGQARGVRWRRRLADVDDDMESRYLRAARSSLEFSLDVPSMGTVEGVLWYFPFENDQETVPVDDATRSRMTLTASAGSNSASQLPPGGGNGGGGGGGRAPLLALNTTQLQTLAGEATQLPGAGKGKLGGAELEMLDLVTSRLLQASPVFEAFWQGRLIPGACVPSLPFLDTVRNKRTAAARDVLPDEAFGRIRGALFFGPGWRVTRNKLTFRDNLQQLLADAVPTDRHLERRTREWLTECHKTLDRSVRFEGIVNQAMQAQARRELGEDVTLFERVHDGLAAVAKGDVVRLQTKPQIVGTVLWFMVPRVVHQEGCYSHGKVTVAPLPAEMFGEGSRHTWPIRRIERVVTRAELAEHTVRELVKLPASLRLEPMKLSGPEVLRVAAGANLPESTVEVLSGAGQRMSRALIAGHKQSLRVVQTLYYVGPGSWGPGDDGDGDPSLLLASPPPGEAPEAPAGEAQQGGAGADEGGVGEEDKGKDKGGGRRGRKRKPQDEAAAAEGGGAKRAAVADAAGEEDGAAEEEAGAGKGRGRGARTGRRGAAAAVAAAEEAAAAGGEGGEEAPPEEAEMAEAGGRRQRGKKGAKKGASTKAAATDGAASGSAKPGGASGAGSASGGGSQSLAPLQGAEVVLRVENKTPSHDLFSFHKLKGGLMRAGRYVLEYSLVPELPGGRVLGRRKRLQVAPGAAASFDLQGEGRAAAQARPLLLGEALPALRVVFRDGANNDVEQLPPAGAVKLEVLSGGLLAGGAVIGDVTADAEVQADKDAGCILIRGLRVLGASGAAAGLSLFPPQKAAGGGGSTQTGAQRDTAAAEAVAAAEVFLAVHVEGMVSQGFPMRVRPGAPQRLELMPGHPFACDARGAAAAGDGKGVAGREPSDEEVVHSTPLEGAQPPAAPDKEQRAGGGGEAGPDGRCTAVFTSGDALPAFQVRVLDAWGNPTAPTPELPFSVALSSSGLDPDQGLFSVDDRGVAAVTGLAARRTDALPPSTQPPAAEPPGAGAAAPQEHRLTLWPQVAELPPPAAAAPPGAPALRATQGGAAAAQEEEALALAVVAQAAYGPGLAAAAGAPAAALKLRFGVTPSTSPATLMFVYQGEALSMVEEAGEDGESAIVWVLSGRPGLEAGSSAQGLALRCLDEIGRPSRPIKGRMQVSWAKGSSKRALGGQDVQMPPLPLPEAAGEPVNAWVRFTGDPKDSPDMCLEVNLRVVPSAGPPVSWGMTLVEYGAQGAKAGGEERDLSVVECGRPFYIEVQALDRFNNKCDLPVDTRPEPKILAVHEGPEAPLQLEHRRKWSQSQWGTDVCQSKLFLAGPVGAVKLSVRDETGEDGASRLKPDELTVTLTPGPPAALAFDGPAQLQCGTRGVLGDLRLRALDNWANLADGAAFEVALNGCALAAEEGALAAKVAASGSNRAKVKGGIALFKGVRLAAEGPGTYLLRAASATRKVAVTDASVTVQVAQQNFVAGLEVAEGSLPQTGCEAGGTHTLQVEVHTEDRQPLPWAAAAAGLQLRLDPLKEKDGASSSRPAPQAEAAVLLPDEEATQAAAAASAAGEAAGMGAVCFVTPPLVAAGRYRVTAEYTETRAELLQALTKADRMVRSKTQEFALIAGPPVAAAVEGPSAAAGAATVSNGAGAAHRRILREVAVQLVDAHGNAAPLAGAKLRWRLAPAQGAEGNGEAPALECEGGGAEQKTDERGRAYFGDVLVAAGTGRVEPASAASGLECELVLRAKLKGQAGGGGGWSECWRCGVLFTDDSARAEALRALQEERDAVQQRLAALKKRLQEAASRVEGSRKEARAAARTAERHAKQLRLPQLLPSSKDAAAALDARRAEAAAVEQQPPAPAAYGPPASGMTQAIQRCLVSKDADMVGVFAQLATVEDRRLAEVVSAAYMGAMQVVVVKTYECITRMRAMLAAGGSGGPVPSMLSYTLIQPFSAEAEGRSALAVRMRGAGPLAQRLQADACDGSDEPLSLVLPHTRMLAAMHERGRAPPHSCDLAMDEWPPGCLGFVVNLLRPAVAGHRRTVLYSQLGRSLVFETMEQAAKYRQTVTQVLRTSLSDIFTLDGQKLSGRGVVVGSSFRVPRLEETHFRFGSRGGGGGGAEAQGGGGLPAQQEEEWVALVAALQQKEAAEAAAEAELARQQEGGGEEETGGVEALQQRLAELGAEIKQQQQQQQQQQRGGGAAAPRSGGKRGPGGGTGGADGAGDGDGSEAAGRGSAAGGKGATAGKRRRMERQQG